MAENKKQPRVILPHSAIDGKLPSSENALAGELFINGASGDGKSFIATKKVDGSIATFHEDAYWEFMYNGFEERLSDVEDTIGDINSILEGVLYNF